MAKVKELEKKGYKEPEEAKPLQRVPNDEAWLVQDVYVLDTGQSVLTLDNEEGTVLPMYWSQYTRYVPVVGDYVRGGWPDKDHPKWDGRVMRL